MTPQLAGMLDGTIDAAGLATAARDRVQFTDADSIILALAARDLLDDGHLTETGCALHNQIPARITDTTGRPGLPKDDVATATRVLNQVRARARALLADL